MQTEYDLHLKTETHWCTVQLALQKQNDSRYWTFTATKKVILPWKPTVQLDDEVSVAFKAKTREATRQIRRWWLKKSVGPSVRCWMTIRQPPVYSPSDDSSKNREGDRRHPATVQPIALDFGETVTKTVLGLHGKLQAKANQVQVGNCCTGGEVHFVYEHHSLVLDRVFIVRAKDEEEEEQKTSRKKRRKR
jgi:hypothetical protein